MTKPINQTVRFKTTPEDVFDALMDSERHSALTQRKAEIENFVGGKFTAFEGGIQGETIELEKNKKIVQKWRSVSWPEGVYSEVTFHLKKENDETVIDLQHTGVPEDEFEKIDQGWEMMYWGPMKKYFE